ncbi:SOCS box domain-containing protein [Phthorimaea operculella]|nr:SOCS box domain-containing protein [Phthorimaea operculella]
MAFFEVSPLCDFNIRESFCELSRMALHRNGMERLWRSNKVLSLQELCCRAIVARTSVYGLERLPLPTTLKSHLKSYAISAAPSRHRARTSKHTNHTRLNCTGRNSCSIT